MGRAKWAAAALGMGTVVVGCSSLLGDFSSGGGSDAGDAGSKDVVHGDGKGDAPRDTSSGDTSQGPDGSCNLGDVHSCGACNNDCTLLPHVKKTGVSCSAGQCQYTCDIGYADCAESGMGCTNDLSKDPMNCGRCGHDCLMGGCGSALCQPFTVTTTSGTIGGLATDGTAVTWSNAADGTVSYLDKIGGTKTVVGGSELDGGPVYNPGGVGLGSTYLNWTQYDGTSTYLGVGTPGVAYSGTVPSSTQISGQGRGFAVSGDDSYVYFLLQYGSNVDLVRFQADGGNEPFYQYSLTSTLAGNNVAIDPTPHYGIFGDVGNSQVVVFSFTSDTATDIPSQPNVYWVATDGTYAYWSSQTGGKNPILFSPLDNPTSVSHVVADSPGACNGITTDGKNVYFIAGAGISYAPTAGAPLAKTLVSKVGLQHITFAGQGIFYDDGTTIYELATP